MDPILFTVGLLIISFLIIVFWGAPYVPTLQRDIRDALQLRTLTTQDVFVDLGCGDGVLLRKTSPLVKKSIGYELNPWMYGVSKLLCAKYKNIDVQYANIWKVTLPKETTVVYVFFAERYMKRLEATLQRHVDKHNTNIDVISLGFKFSQRKEMVTQGALYLYRFAPLQA